MKKVLKVFGYLLLGLIAVLAIAFVVIRLKSNSLLERRHAVTVAAPWLPVDVDAPARGRHLAETRGCADCHGHDFGGAKVVDDSAMGRLYGPNLTRGRGGLPPDFNDSDWAKAIRHGIGKDGHSLFLMPSTDYARFTVADLGDLIAYLKSVPAVDRDRVPILVGPVARALLIAGKIKLAADEIDHADLKPEVVTPAITVDYGRYIATGCTGCHGANLSGGKIDIGPPDWPPAANLTPHATGRLAKWTEADFLATLRTAKRPDGTELSPVMPRAFGQMNDTELKAVWAYLQTLPATETGKR